MISFSQKGDYKKLSRYLSRLKDLQIDQILNAYGQKGVAALSTATPVESGLTSSSWSYEVEKGNKFSKIVFLNSHINKGVPIAIILQYGHGTGTGGWVEGRDYINPAIQPVFDGFAADAWREVTNV